MNTVFPARASPVTPRRRVGWPSPVAKSRTPPAAIRAPSIMPEKLTERIVGGGSVQRQDAPRMRSHPVHNVLGPDEAEEACLAILHVPPIGAFEFEHGE